MINIKILSFNYEIITFKYIKKISLINFKNIYMYLEIILDNFIFLILCIFVIYAKCSQ